MSTFLLNTLVENIVKMNSWKLCFFSHILINKISWNLAFKLGFYAQRTQLLSKVSILWHQNLQNFLSELGLET